MNSLQSSIVINNLSPKLIKDYLYIPTVKSLIKLKDNKVVTIYDLPKIDNVTNVNQPTEDLLLNYHIFDECIILIGANSKRIAVYNLNGEKLKDYIHTKKITNSVIHIDNEIIFILFSDKFGEVYLLNTQTMDKATLLYGHAEIISFLLKTKKDDVLISSDGLGKIKICEFPNIFEIRSVIMYDSYRFVGLIEDKYLFVLDFHNNGHIWKLSSIEKIKEFKVKEEAKRIEIVANKIIIQNKSDHLEIFTYVENEEIKQEEIKDFSNNNFYYDYNNSSIIAFNIKEDNTIGYLNKIIM